MRRHVLLALLASGGILAGCSPTWVETDEGREDPGDHHAHHQASRYDNSKDEGGPLTSLTMWPSEGRFALANGGEHVVSDCGTYTVDANHGTAYRFTSAIDGIRWTWRVTGPDENGLYLWTEFGATWTVTATGTQVHANYDALCREAL